jgi:uncharacterized membrane protein YgdD (TMEM256/DUF423 family)
MLISLMTNATATRVAAIAGFLAVALGAFGAHGLNKILAQNGTAAIWETAALYHFIHAVMLFVLAGRKPLAIGPWWCFLTGIVIFSGSLYLLAATDARWQETKVGYALDFSALLLKVAVASGIILQWACSSIG